MPRKQDRAPTVVPPSLVGKGDRGLGEPRPPVVLGQPVDATHAERAKQLRREMTPGERMIWAKVRRNGLAGLHVRRQQVIDGFIVDFYCHAARLVVEIDGGAHAEREECDRKRDRHLAARGLAILRIRNEEIRRDPDGAIARIAEVALNRLRSLGNTGAAAAPSSPLPS